MFLPSKTTFLPCREVSRSVTIVLSLLLFRWAGRDRVLSRRMCDKPVERQCKKKSHDRRSAIHLQFYGKSRIRSWLWHALAGFKYRSTRALRSPVKIETHWCRGTYVCAELSSDEKKTPNCNATNERRSAFLIDLLLSNRALNHTAELKSCACAYRNQKKITLLCSSANVR